MGSCASKFKDSNAAKKEAVEPPEEEKLVVVEVVKEDEAAEGKPKLSLGKLFKEIDEGDEHEFVGEPREVNSLEIDGEKEKKNESITDPDPKQEFAEVEKFQVPIKKNEQEEVFVTHPKKEEPIDQ